jgi:hypothetical protein
MQIAGAQHVPQTERPDDRERCFGRRRRSAVRPLCRR